MRKSYHREIEGLMAYFASFLLTTCPNGIHARRKFSPRCRKNALPICHTPPRIWVPTLPERTAYEHYHRRTATPAERAINGGLRILPPTCTSETESAVPRGVWE